VPHIVLRLLKIAKINSIFQKFRAPRFWRVHRPAKVGNFHVALETDEQILRLDVTMNDFLRVAIVKRSSDLINVLQKIENFLKIPDTNSRSLVFGKFALLLQQFEHFTTSGKFEYQIDSFFVVEIVVQFQNVRML